MASSLLEIADGSHESKEREKSRSSYELQGDQNRLRSAGSTDALRRPDHRGIRQEVMSPKAPFGVRLTGNQTDPSDSMASWDQLTDPMRSQGALGDDGDLAMVGPDEQSQVAPRSVIEGSQHIGADHSLLSGGAVMNHLLQEVRRPDGEVWFKEMKSIFVDKELLDHLTRRDQYSAETVDEIHVFMEQVGRSSRESPKSG